MYVVLCSIALLLLTNRLFSDFFSILLEAMLVLPTVIPVLRLVVLSVATNLPQLPPALKFTSTLPDLVTLFSFPPACTETPALTSVLFASLCKVVIISLDPVVLL